MTIKQTKESHIGRHLWLDGREYVVVGLQGTHKWSGYWVAPVLADGTWGKQETCSNYRVNHAAGQAEDLPPRPPRA